MTQRMPNLSGAACATPQGMRLFADIDTDWTDWTIKRCRKICEACPVQPTCLQWGVLHERDGMWGGLLPEELKGERRRRQIRVDKPTFSLQVLLQQQTAAKQAASAKQAAA